MLTTDADRALLAECDKVLEQIDRALGAIGTTIDCIDDLLAEVRR